MVESSAIEFFKRKRDFSPFLVHLTKDNTHSRLPANEILEKILNEQTLVAANHYCLFDSDLKKSKNASIKDKFKVVCFTETPIDLIDVLLLEVEGRYFFRPKPFGLVFTKDFISECGGNPVFYASGGLFDSLWHLYNDAKARDFGLSDHKFLALVNRCDDQIDFHWEREWRVVGDLKFTLDDVYCALCPESHMAYFECRFIQVPFIDPHWGINDILNKLVQKARTSTDIPF